MVYSNYVSIEDASPGFDGSYPKTKMFDGDTSTRAIATQAKRITFAPQETFGLIDSLRVWVSNATSYGPLKIVLDGATEYANVENNWSELPRYKGKTWGPNTTLQFQSNDMTYGRPMDIHAIEINGFVLIDSYVLKVDQMQEILERLETLEKKKKR